MSMKKSPNNQKKADVKTDEKAAGSQEAAATPAPTARRRSSTAKKTRRNARKADGKAHEAKVNPAKEADQADPADLVVSSASSAPSSPASAMNDVVQTAADPEGSGVAEDWDAIPDPVVDSGSCDIEKEDADGGAAEDAIEDAIEDDKADVGADAHDISLPSSESASVSESASESASVAESASGSVPASVPASTDEPAVKEPQFVMPLKDHLPMQVMMGAQRAREKEEAVREARQAQLAREEALRTDPAAMRQVYALDRRGNVTVTWVERTTTGAAADGDATGEASPSFDPALGFDLMAALASLNPDEDRAAVWEAFAERAGLTVLELKEAFAHFCRMGRTSRDSASATMADDSAGDVGGSAAEEAVLPESPVAAERASRTGVPLGEVLNDHLEAARRDPSVAAAVASRCESLKGAWAQGRAVFSSEGAAKPLQATEATEEKEGKEEDEKSESEGKELENVEGKAETKAETKTETKTEAQPAAAGVRSAAASILGSLQTLICIAASDVFARLKRLGQNKDTGKALEGKAEEAAEAEGKSAGKWSLWRFVKSTITFPVRFVFAPFIAFIVALVFGVLRIGGALLSYLLHWCTGGWKRAVSAGVAACLVVLVVVEGPAGALSRVSGAVSGLLKPTIATVDLRLVRGVLLEAAAGSVDEEENAKNGKGIGKEIGKRIGKGNTLELALIINEHYEELLARALRDVAVDRRAVLLDASNVLVAHEDAVFDATAEVREHILTGARRALAAREEEEERRERLAARVGDPAWSARFREAPVDTFLDGCSAAWHWTVGKWNSVTWDCATTAAKEAWDDFPVNLLRWLASFFWPGQSEMVWPDSLQELMASMNVEPRGSAVLDINDRTEAMDVFRDSDRRKQRLQGAGSSESTRRPAETSGRRIDSMDKGLRSAP